MEGLIIDGYIIARLSILTIATMDIFWALYPAIAMLGIFGIGHMALADVLMMGLAKETHEEV